MEVQPSVSFKCFIHASWKPRTHSFQFKWSLNSKKWPNPLIYLQVIEPIEKDQGKYSIVIVDPENSHKRTLDLSGEGAVLSVSYHLHTPSLRQPLEKYNLLTFQVSDTHPCWLRCRLWKVGKVLLKKTSDPYQLQRVPLGEWKCVSISQRTPQKLWAFLASLPSSILSGLQTASMLPCSPSRGFFSLFLLQYVSLADIY